MHEITSDKYIICMAHLYWNYNSEDLSGKQNEHTVLGIMGPLDYIKFI